MFYGHLVVRFHICKYDVKHLRSLRKREPASRWYHRTCARILFERAVPNFYGLSALHEEANSAQTRGFCLQVCILFEVPPRR